jgi:hypothetical protein
MSIHACPFEQVEALAGAIDTVTEGEFELTELVWVPDPADPSITIGARALREDTCPDATEWELTIDEVVCGWTDSLDAAALIAAAPDAVWDFHEDPKYEWLGHGVCYSPQTGLIDVGNADANGNEVLNAYEARQAMEAYAAEHPNAWSVADIVAALYPSAAYDEVVRVLEHAQLAAANVEAK